MKQSIYMILSGLFLFTLNSCEAIIEEEPQTFFSEDEVFNTEAGVESIINGMYQSYADVNYHGGAIHALLGPHSGKFFSSQGSSEDATSLNCQPSNIWVTRMWPQMYSTINIANTIILNLEDNAVQLENRETALGDAYFLRAATYFDLVRLFGGVPIRLEPANIETLHLPRSTKEEVYNLIIQDFERAKQLMPSLGANRPGRPANLAASMFLAKVYMSMAGEDGGDPSLWTNARDEALEVFGQYSLTTTYAELFQPSNENTQESIFELQYGQNGAVLNSETARSFTPSKSTLVPQNVITFGRFRPNKETFDAHVNQYPEDPRINATYIFDQYEIAEEFGGGIQTIYPTRLNGNDGFAVLKKYLDPSYNGTTTSRNFIKLRYADLLLMLAEIENEITGPGNAYQYVNEVLARARNTNDGIATQPEDYTNLSQDEFRTRILKERQYELLGEGHVWYDTRRRGYQYFLDEVIVAHNNHPTLNVGGNNPKDFIYPTSVKNMLLPIPSNEISGNQAISQANQNPGY